MSTFRLKFRRVALTFEQDVLQRPPASATVPAPVLELVLTLFGCHGDAVMHLFDEFRLPATDARAAARQTSQATADLIGVQQQRWADRPVAPGTYRSAVIFSAGQLGARFYHQYSDVPLKMARPVSENRSG